MERKEENNIQERSNFKPKMPPSKEFLEFY